MNESLSDPGEQPGAVACNLSVIPASERAAHAALARKVLFADETRVRDIEEGLMFEVRPDRLIDVVTFLENERRCCRHLGFTLEIPPREADLILRVTGPGASDELRALVR